MGEERTRGVETLSGETHNVQNNTKHWGGFPQSLERPVRREVAKAGQSPRGQRVEVISDSVPGARIQEERF